MRKLVKVLLLGAMLMGSGAVWAADASPYIAEAWVDVTDTVRDGGMFRRASGLFGSGGVYNDGDHIVLDEGFGNATNWDRVYLSVSETGEKALIFESGVAGAKSVAQRLELSARQVDETHWSVKLDSGRELSVPLKDTGMSNKVQQAESKLNALTEAQTLISSLKRKGESDSVNGAYWEVNEAAINPQKTTVDNQALDELRSQYQKVFSSSDVADQKKTTVDDKALDELRSLYQKVFPSSDVADQTSAPIGDDLTPLTPIPSEDALSDTQTAAATLLPETVVGDLEIHSVLEDNTFQGLDANGQVVTGTHDPDDYSITEITRDETTYAVDENGNIKGTNISVKQFLQGESPQIASITINKSASSALGLGTGTTTLTSEQVTTLLNHTGFVESSKEAGGMNIGPGQDGDGSVAYYYVSVNPNDAVIGEAFKQSISSANVYDRTWSEYQTLKNEVTSLTKAVDNGTATRKELTAAQEALKEKTVDLVHQAKAGLSDANDTYNKTVEKLTNLVNAQVDENLQITTEDTKKALATAKDSVKNTGAAKGTTEYDQALADAFVEALGSDYEGIETGTTVDGRTIDGTQSIENTAGQVTQAEDAVDNAQNKVNEANQVDAEASGTGADLTDVIRLALQVWLPLVASDDLDIEKDINIAAGDVGDLVEPIDETSLATDTGADETAASTVVGAASTVKQLLQAAVVDMDLLSESVTVEEEETTTTTTTQTGNAGGVAYSGSSVGSTPVVKTDTEDEDETTTSGTTTEEETEDPITEAKKKEIESRRAKLLRQYVAAAIQIAEGMNAISNHFFDRADAVVASSSGIQTEGGAFVLAQDTARYVLLETLRGVALSSIQMGVQSARLLKDQSVTISSDDSDNKE